MGFHLHFYPFKVDFYFHFYFFKVGFTFTFSPSRLIFTFNSSRCQPPSPPLPLPNPRFRFQDFKFRAVLRLFCTTSIEEPSLTRGQGFVSSKTFMKQICHILKDWQLTNHYQLVTTLKLVNCQRLPSLLRAFSGLKQGLNGLALPTYNLWFLQKLFQRIVEIYNLAYAANRFSFCSTNVKQSFLKSLEGAEKVQKWPKTSKKCPKIHLSDICSWPALWSRSHNSRTDYLSVHHQLPGTRCIVY